MLKDNVDICTPILMEIFDNCINNGTLADKLKFDDISQIFKSIDSIDKKYHRPISILKSVPKLFEKSIKKQLLTNELILSYVI